MSDYSYDSDSDDEEEEEVEDVKPRVTYDSLMQHSRKQPSQERLANITPSQSARNNGKSVGQRQYQNHPNNSSHSNFPPDFDEHFKARNFDAKTETQSKHQRAEMNMQHAQPKLERGNYRTQGGREDYLPSFPNRDYQQNTPSVSSVRPKHPQSTLHASHMQQRAPRNENMHVHPPSAYGSGHQEYPSRRSNGPSYATGRDAGRRHHQNDYMTHQIRPGIPSEETYIYDSNEPNFATSDVGGRRHQNQYPTKMNPHQIRPGISAQEIYANDRVDYNKLKEWSTFPNNTMLIFDISVHLQGLSKLLKQDSVQFEWIHHLILILKKIINVEPQRTTLNYILKVVCESKFLKVHLHSFLSELQRQRTYPDTYGCFLKLVDVLEYTMKNLKDFASYCNQCLQNLLEVGRNLNILSQENELTRHIQKLLEQTTRRNIKDFQVPVNTVPHQNRREKSVPMPDDEEPPDRYQEMALFPDTEELVASIEPFLRANKTKGAYRDVSHYLDIQSRLMKEDYLSPIRTGLKNFKLALQNNTNVREDDLRFYYNVKIAKISFESDQGITHFVHFDNSPFRELDWEFSKRLMFGSLLVFSNDNFESTIFATVASRDINRIQRGVLEVMFQNNLEKVFTSSENDIFIMAETTAYFESYRYVLEGLQEMRTIPLERYIISCMREIHPPQYLHENMCYNIASIMNSVYDNYPVPVLNSIEWPSADSTSLNDSQLEALQLALSNEIAIIQGPPGTGKTYVGLKIMRIILENKVMRRAFDRRGPILVVCFTNHALDQFLEGMLDFCQTGIVRVGGRSSSQLLENFNLRQLRNNRNLTRKIPGRILEALKSLRRQLKAVSMAINRHWQETLRLETTILSVRDLQEEMSERHRESLTDPRRETNERVHIMSTWLKASNANMDNFLNKAAIKHLGKVIAEGGNIQNDSSLNNKKSAAKTDFHTRVKIYHYWVKKYETVIAEEIDKLLSDETPVNERKVLELMATKDEISNDVLRDDILQPYMSDKVYESIKGCVQLESKEEIDESSYVRHWLLNRVTRTDQLLDAIEQLTVKTPAAKQHQGRRMFADTETAVRENRWVVDDSDGTDANTDDSSDEDDEGKDEGRSMDDLDDGGTVKMSDIKELENSYKQFQDREIIMLQRAKMLGIDLTVKEDEQWQKANAMSYSKVFSLYHKAEAYTEEEASTITDLWNLQVRDRYRLYKYWVLEKKQKLTRRLIDLTTEYKFISKCKKKASSFKDVEILKRAKVIGMTTTGAAKHRDVLQDVGCRIIVVEEAAEVLEAHIVTTLNSNCQHLILIGDHQQLRPSPTVHKLAVDYDLEISLFERLIKNNIPHVTLTEQHRMRPEISTYLQHIYPNLQDHISVFKYDNIRGVNSNVFFLQHEYKESEVDDTTSKANIHEARFLTGLCKYFIQHEYRGSQITVLAAYSGQVKSIRDEMEKEESIFEYVRVTSIDNYQGEENDIILLSLVRSNEMNEVGFLKTDNRVCVALSRAKMGLFVIGNFQLLASKSTLWRNIVYTAKEDHVYGIGMKMVCINHSHITYIVNPEDFAKEVPEGGCMRPCDAILPCGHTCPRLCHSSDLQHESTRCTQPCLKVCPQGHPCQKDCYRECGKCEVRVIKEIPLCGHKDQVPCFLSVDEVRCSQSCGATRACGHICRGQCGICMTEGHQPCLEKVDKVWPCTHRNNVECRTDTSTDPCPMKCNMRLDCGHKCKGTCGGCLSGRVHKACAEKCKQPLPCGHPCESLCGVICAPCKLRCPTSCRHGPCAKPSCGDPCEPCMENCAMVCQHRKCAALCMEECVEPPCSNMCGKPTPCKHKCTSLCGEICVCYQCEKNLFHLIDTSSKKQPKWMVAHEKQERAKKFEVSKDTVLMKIPKCKHIFTLAQLDRYVNSFEPENTSFLRCPVCPAPVQGISRYENINHQRAERRENMKEEIIKNSRVSERKISKLIKSKLVVEHFCTVDEGEFLSRKPDLIDSNHALALSMQMRFAFALSKVYSIHKSFNHDIDFKIRKWKLIISSIQLSMPPQLCTEMTMEIHRLLLCEQITFFTKMFKNMDVPLKDEVKANLRAVLKELSKQQKLITEEKNSFQRTLDNLYEEYYRMAPSDEWSADAKSLQNQVASVTLVLDQPQAEDLITILQQSAPQELNVQATRVLEEGSDTEDEEETEDEEYAEDEEDAENEEDAEDEEYN